MMRLYAYRLRTISRDRANMFWMLVFPILMATLFYFAFGSAQTTVETFVSIPVAVVGQGEEAFSQMISNISKGDEPLLTVTNTDMGQAEALLNKGEVDGIIDAYGPSLVVKEDGLNQSILKSILDHFLQVEQTVANIAEEDPAQIRTAVSDMTEIQPVLKQITFSGGSLNFWQQSFYALFAMACLYGSFFGLSGVLSMQPGLSEVGARCSITPTHKSQMVWSVILGATTVVFAAILLLLAYMAGALGISFGHNTPPLLLTCLCGAFVGVMAGIFIGAVFKMAKGAKEGILIGGTLLLCFLAGMMYPNMRYIIEQSAPIVNRLNPAALIVDSFYTLDTYGVGARYWMDTLLLVAMGSILCAVSVVALRRKQYASI